MRMPWRPHRDGHAQWPVVLRDAEPGPTVVLRPLRLSDMERWRRLRQDNVEHVRPWEPTLPPGAERRSPVTFKQYVHDLDAEARADRALPWVLEVQGVVVGQVHVFDIVRAAQQSAALGYWIDHAHTGRGLTTRAVRLAIAHALGPAGLHRIEVNIRVDNEASLAVVHHLGLRDEGIRERFLHIDGAWRDHRTFAITAEELGALHKKSLSSHE